MLGDEFDYNLATEQISHRPAKGGRKARGRRVGAYTVVKNVHGEILPLYKDAEFIESIKSRSPSSKSRFSPWNSKHETDIDAMWLKTVVRQAAKWVPKSSTPQGVAYGKAVELEATDGGLIDIEDAQILTDDIDVIKEEVLGVGKE